MASLGFLLGIPLSSDSNFMSIQGGGMYFIPLCSWRRAQQSSAIRIEICLAVVKVPLQKKTTS